MPILRFSLAARTAALVCVLGLPVGVWGHAPADHDHDRARQALEQGRVLALRQVLEKVEREYQGQVLKIEFDDDDGRLVYEIRLLQNDGRLLKLKVDAVDGRILKIKGKRPDADSHR